jgi:ubiquinone/menaquinone biosynthesis C-methylase UbiE
MFDRMHDHLFDRLLRWGQRALPGALFWMYRRRSRVIKWMYRARYQSISRAANDDELHFMNLGYAPLPTLPEPVDLALAPTEEPYRLQIQLYHQVGSRGALRGARVLEVGCGRGGGSAYLARRFEPAAMVSIDLSERAIEFCRRKHAVPGLAFELGDAERLPFARDRFDVLINVESLHCYPAPAQFLGEAFRVLRPGGQLLLAALYPAVQMGHVGEMLAAAGFHILHDEDMRASVIRAQEAILSRLAPPSTGNAVSAEILEKQRVALEHLTAGRMGYRCWTCRKPGT